MNPPLTPPVGENPRLYGACLRSLERRRRDHGPRWRRGTHHKGAPRGLLAPLDPPARQRPAPWLVPSLACPGAEMAQLPIVPTPVLEAPGSLAGRSSSLITLNSGNTTAPHPQNTQGGNGAHARAVLRRIPPQPRPPDELPHVHQRRACARRWLGSPRGPLQLPSGLHSIPPHRPSISPPWRPEPHAPPRGRRQASPSGSARRPPRVGSLSRPCSLYPLV
ncbi:hypothetical protein ES705_29077 [subsurface metagenome]